MQHADVSGEMITKAVNKENSFATLSKPGVSNFCCATEQFLLTDVWTDVRTKIEI